MNEPEIRVADHDRERAAAALGEHFSQGRIDLEEYHQRLDVVHRARTRGELEAPFADLPGEEKQQRTPVEAPRQDVWLRLAGVASALSLVLFLVCGFALNGWAWSWIFFVLPGALAKLARSEQREPQSTDRIEQRPAD